MGFNLKKKLFNAIFFGFQYFFVFNSLTTMSYISDRRHVVNDLKQNRNQSKIVKHPKTAICQHGQTTAENIYISRLATCRQYDFTTSFVLI